LTKTGFKILNTTLNHVGDGGVFTTVEDLYLWDQAFYNHKLGKDLMDSLHQKGVLNDGKELNYALGLNVGRYKGLKMVSHGGGFVGFRADMIRFPDEKFSVVCLANYPVVNPSTICRKIADIYLADKMAEEKPSEKERETQRKKPPAAVPLTEKQLEEYVGTYYNDELETTYSLVVEKGKLFFRHRNAPRGALRYSGEDTFRSGYGILNFHRGRRKKITGFLLDAGRVRIQFTKR
jgi:hypothetical protein